MIFPGLEGTPERAIARFLARRGKRCAVQDVPRRVRVRHRRHAARGGRAGHPDDGARARLRLADGLPVALGAGRVQRRRPELAARTTSSTARWRTSSGRSRAPARASCRGCRTSRSARRTAPAEVAAQIRAARDAGADEFLLWDPEVTYTGGRARRDREDAGHRHGDGEAARGAPGPPVACGTRSRRRRPDEPAGTARSRGRAAPPNELGQIPVLMHHQIRPTASASTTSRPNEFRAELQRLWKEGFVAGRASATRQRAGSTSDGQADRS